MRIRSELHQLGARYRVHIPPLPALRTRADIVFTSKKVAVFVDGCFWHACPDHASWPKEHSEWWRKKILTNVQRDRRDGERASGRPQVENKKINEPVACSCYMRV